MPFLARTYVHCFGPKENNTFYLAKYSSPRAKGFGEKNEKFDMSSSSKIGLLFL